MRGHNAGTARRQGPAFPGKWGDFVCSSGSERSGRPCGVLGLTAFSARTGVLSLLPHDVVVAHRQNNNGMAWSEDGSHALATLASVRRNGEVENWLHHRRLAFRLPNAA